MAKNSRLVAQQTEALIHNTIVEIFFDSGWEAVTYGEISKKTGVSRSGIQRVVPSKMSMLDAFQGEILTYILDNIKAHQGKSLKESWVEALSEKKFAHCARFLLSSPNLDQNGLEKAASAVDTLISQFGREEIIELVGLTLLYFIEQGEKA